ncbi:sugar transferase [Streptococcus sp. S784/96/1]|uniref:sugar transferase n=1 Tax=Streptococcus sp. S784/96/1 TaxID=2653499 RepID=UPI0013872DCE|nr:sugar transferase [Streptococcus sp. S784/96/1]
MLKKDFLNVREVNEARKHLEKKKMSLVLKRIFDIVASVMLLVLLSPVFFVLFIGIKVEDGGPVFYRQERVTTNGKLFRIFKFRTMVMNADKMGSLVTTQNDSRITKIGSKIRDYRLDEIPQLINVLKGEMSFVGTRPEVLKYVEAYSDEMKTTLLLPAGVTSLSSICFKDEDEMIEKFTSQGENIDDIYINRILPEKMKLNVEYIHSFNFLSDIKIMLLTVISVIK